MIFFSVLIDIEYPICPYLQWGEIHHYDILPFDLCTKCYQGGASFLIIEPYIHNTVKRQVAYRLLLQLLGPWSDVSLRINNGDPNSFHVVRLLRHRRYHGAPVIHSKNIHASCFLGPNLDPLELSSHLPIRSLHTIKKWHCIVGCTPPVYIVVIFIILDDNFIPRC